MSDESGDRGRAGIGLWVRSGLVASARGLYLAVLSQVGCALLLTLTLTSIAFIGLGIGILMLPAVMVWVRVLARQQRRLAERWSGVHIPDPYRPPPPFEPSGLAGRWQRCRWLLSDPATWRDMLWMFGEATIGLVLTLLPAALVAYGIEGILVAPFLLRNIDGYYYGLSWLVGQSYGAWLAVPQGVLFLLVGLAIGPPVLRLHDRFARWLLAPTPKSELHLRVRQLTETRAETVDTQTAELRRIERDLHDGAQARMVALGMSLGLAEEMVTQNPEAARELLAEARQASGQALAELRDLVRGIHPPVLAERGLTGAVQALALTLPLPVDVDVDVPGRLPAPVESAAYFAVAEALANVAKHGAASTALVQLGYVAGKLCIRVMDDGRGGADPERGTGLRGMQRRLAAFDGTLAVTSPLGGPTVVTMELPCELSSPKTSRSSGMA